MQGIAGASSFGQKEKVGQLSPHRVRPQSHLQHRLTHPYTKMTSAEGGKESSESARAPLTSDELKEAFKIEVYDRAGNKRALSDLIEGKRSVLIFTRHFCKLFPLELETLLT